MSTQEIQSLRDELQAKREARDRPQIDFSKLEFWPLRTETHIVSVSTDRVVRHVGVIWSGS